jgi:2-haloacid dehalogenase
MDLTRFRVLSFDCYGTLIDWESGIAAILRPWGDEVGAAATDEELLVAYADQEADVARENPQMLYPDVLAAAFRHVGAALDRPVNDTWARRLAGSVPDWPAFPDSAEALHRLARHYQLVIVSNVHRDGFAASNQHLGGRFTAVITAEDVGAYKPAANHFRVLERTMRDLGAGRTEVLHVAQSLFHDHVPAKRERLRSVWINRRHDRPGWGATPEPSEEWTYDAKFPSMAAFADTVDEQFGG